MRARVLIIFPGALGDLICFLPALKALMARHPGCQIELMARSELADFATRRTGVERGHSIDRREMALLFSREPSGTIEAGRFFGQFSAIHSYFGSAQPQMRQALAKSCNGEVTFNAFRPMENFHIAAAYLAELGEIPTPGCCELALTMEDLRQARELLEYHHLSERRFILFLPGSGSPGKNWPAEKFASLAMYFADMIPALFVLGPAEAGIAGLLSGLNRVHEPALGTLAALAQLSLAFVGNDSGVSHLAAAARAKGVVIFGPTDPKRWRPLGEVAVVQRMPLEDLRWQEVASALGQVCHCAD